MDVELYPPMLPGRPCRFCLSLQGGSVFADFDVDPDGRVFAARVSFDGYGCCHAPVDVGRMNAPDSAVLLAIAPGAPRYDRPMAGSWRDIEAQLAAYRERSWQPAGCALGSIFVMLVIGLATDNMGLAFVPLIIGISTAIYLSVTLGVRCPACRGVMNDIGSRGASPLMLLVNLKQCPMCQNKFDDDVAA